MGVYAVNKQVIFSLLMSQASKEKPAECNDPPLEGPPEAYQGNFWSGIPRNSQIYSTGTVDGQNPAPVFWRKILWELITWGFYDV